MVLTKCSYGYGKRWNLRGKRFEVEVLFSVFDAESKSQDYWIYWSGE